MPEDDATPIADWSMQVALLFVLLFYIAVLWLHDPTEDKTDDPPGQMAVTVHWPETSCSDVDLWGMFVPNARAVGYSALGSRVLNLLRDDLGCRNDSMALNYETMYSRGLPDGEYVFNLHLYRGEPVPVHYEVVVARPDGGRSTLTRGTVDLSAVGQELTFARVVLRDGRAPRGPVSTLHLPIRTQR